jgi:hypothetical protein
MFGSGKASRSVRVAWRLGIRPKQYRELEVGERRRALDPSRYDEPARLRLLATLENITRTREVRPEARG